MRPRALFQRLACALLLAALCAPDAVAVDDLESHWVGRFHALQTEQRSLARDLEAARVEYRRGRRSNRGRGDERVELLTLISRLEQKLATIEAELAALPEEARKAGALPGWFRADEDNAPAPARGAPTLDRSP